MAPSESVIAGATQLEHTFSTGLGYQDTLVPKPTWHSHIKTTSHNHERTIMAEKKTTTSTTKTERKPRRSAIERLQEELREAQEAQANRARKKIANAKAKLENLLVQMAKLEERIAAAEAELAAAKAELPIVTDGVGQPGDAIVTDGTDPEPVEADEDPEA